MRDGTRILALLTDGFGGHGGMAKFNRDFLGAAAEHPRVATIRVLVRHPVAPDTPLPRKIGMVFAGQGGKAAYAAASLREYTRAPLHLVFCGHLNLLPLAAITARAAGACLLLSLHGIEAWGPSPSSSRTAASRARPPLAIRAALPTVSAITSVSRFTLERFQAWAHPRAPGHVVPNMFDAASERAFGAQPAELPGMDLGGGPMLLTLGRLDARERYKGVDEVMAVLPALLGQFPGLKFVVAGDGSDRLRLMEKARQRGLGDHVLFPGRVTDAQKWALFARAQAFTMAGYGEGFGIVFLEALACGVPVVGSRLDGSREALLDGRLGQVVDPRAPEELLAGLRTALTAQHGVPPGLDHYGRQAFVSRVHALLEASIP